MVPTRGFVTAAILIFIALSCVAAVRRLERDRRILRVLRERAAYDVRTAVRLDSLNPDERDSAEALAQAGVVAIRENRCYLLRSQVTTFRSKRIRLALSGALGAVLIAILLALLILRR
ncbi:MAG TPA: hypothetical protein VGM84_17670 [Steroidobacteraceae bacterium]